MWSPNLYYKLIGDYSFAKAFIPPVEPGVYLAQAAKLKHIPTEFGRDVLFSVSNYCLAGILYVKISYSPEEFGTCTDRS